MEAWRYTALNTQFNNLQQKLLSTMQTTKENNSLTGCEPMDDDFYNNNLNAVNTGIKRKANNDLHHEVSQKKSGKRESTSDEWSINSCLKLDVYTQTDHSFVADSRTKTLSYVSEIVQANSKKLEHIENFLETFGNKIESFLSSQHTSVLTKKRKSDAVMETEHSVTQERQHLGPVSTTTCRLPSEARGSPTPASLPSPTVCLSPGLAPGGLHTETPDTVNSPRGWGHAFQPAPAAVSRSVSQELLSPKVMTAFVKGAESAGNGWADAGTKPTILEARLEPLTMGPQRSGVDSDNNVRVPVIISVGVKPKKSVTTEVPLHNIMDGTVCTMEEMEHVSYSHGCWLGDKSNPDSRVWYCGDPKLLHRAEASGTNPAKLSLNLLEALFVRDEMAASNINGARGRELLDPIKIKAIQAHINYKFPIEPDKEELRWQFLKPRIDSKCRAQRRLQREQLARLENSPQGVVERPFRSRLRVDPKEKDELLYGYSRSADSGISATAVDEFRETETECKASGVDQLQAHEAIVEISGTPVTVVEPNV